MARKTYTDKQKDEIVEDAKATSVKAAADKHKVAVASIYIWMRGKKSKKQKGAERTGGRLLSSLASLKADVRDLKTRVAKLEKLLS